MDAAPFYRKVVEDLVPADESAILNEFAERPCARAVEDGVQMGIAADAGRKSLAVAFAQGIHPSVAVLLAGATAAEMAGPQRSADPKPQMRGRAAGTWLRLDPGLTLGAYRHSPAARKTLPVSRSAGVSSLLHARSRHVLAWRLTAAPEVLGEKCLCDGVERQTVLGPVEAMPLVRVDEIADRQPALAHGGDDLVGLGYLAADTDDTGRVFRFEAGHRSDAKSDGTPI